MIDLSCRCQGRDRDDPCNETADGEDGLCHWCRYPDGSCCEGKTWCQREEQIQRKMMRVQEEMQR